MEQIIYSTDASFNAEEKMAKIAFFNHTCNIESVATIKCNNIVEAEFKAIRKAIKNSRHWSKAAKVFVSNDNQEAVKLAIDEYSKLESHKNIQIKWIPREQNAIADKLTKW